MNKLVYIILLLAAADRLAGQPGQTNLPSQAAPSSQSAQTSATAGPLSTGTQLGEVPATIHVYESDYPAMRVMDIVPSLQRILSFSKQPEKIKAYTLVRIADGSFDAQKNVSNGTIDLIDPLDTSKRLRTVPFINLHMLMGGTSGGPARREGLRPSPYFVNTPAYALCILDAKQLAEGQITALPQETLLIPDDWVPDFGKMFTLPDVADFFTVPKEAPADFKFPTKWALLLYGNDLAQEDFSRFKNAYFDLLANGDLYTTAFFTDLLMNGGINNKLDVFSDINRYINSNNANPDTIGAIVAGMLTSPNPILLIQSDPNNKTKINGVLTLVKQKALADSPDWTNTLRILGLTKMYPELK